VRRWQEVRDRFPAATPWYGGLGAALLEADRLDEADAVLSEGVGRVLDDVWLRISWARAAAQRQDWPEAVRRWEEVRDRFPDATLWYGGLGVALLKAGRTEEAEAVLSEGVRRAPGDFWVAFHHAGLAMRPGRWAEAAGRWYAVVSRWPDRPLGFVGLCQALLELGEVARAEQVAQLSRVPGNTAQTRPTRRLRSSRAPRPRGCRY
jgi:predicted Zn-dependent protease